MNQTSWATQVADHSRVAMSANVGLHKRWRGDVGVEKDMMGDPKRDDPVSPNQSAAAGHEQCAAWRAPIGAGEAVPLGSETGT